MIASHKHGFVFLKTLKTAGTSIEIALSGVCGREDILTPLHPPADEEARRARSGLGAQNFRFPVTRASTLSGSDWKRFVLGRGWRKAYNHMSACEVRQLIGPERFADYVKFAVIRNPWDAAVSHYYWLHSDTLSFDEYLRSPHLEFLTRNWEIISIDNSVVVDHVLRFEQLSDDYSSILRSLKLPAGAALPHAKSSTRPASARYREMYDAEGVERVRSVAHPQIEVFGYAF
ncbi:sulfotransferase family 2 domain-containing protein [Demequina sp. NBRC 110056]|uniref:sulfotransferase family 2 domain-containing protein n=1 Tax=Demequina sp. NBRC 110056 TaxID=1570345 RepID=UPI00117E803C|nr:sulfotransferase family 2 domain-containing protein [Demequina sp. NBRC 110056]